MMRSFKFLIKAIVFLLFTGSMYAQNTPDITKLEYYIDIDPGYGLGSQILITPDSAVNIFDVIDLSTTATGFHILGVRAMDENGVWGITHTHRFHVADKSFSEALSDVVEVEYFFNTDAGYGQGQNLTITSDSILHITPLIDLSSVVPGINVMGIRAKDAEGHWGLTHTHLFHLTETSIEEPLLDIVEVEYFLNTDAGYGQEQSINVTPDSLLHITPLIDLSAATPGFNLLGVRAKDSGGHWGTTHTHRFHVDDVMHAPLAHIVEIEYFFNAPDPGIGLGFTIPTTIANHIDTALIINLTGLAIGPHFMGIRAKDDAGSYSHTYIHSFELFEAPIAYNFEGGGIICDGIGNPSATISHTDIGVDYVLHKDGLPIQPPVAGIGADITWAYLNEGTYTLIAYNSSAPQVFTQMNGIVTVTEHPLPTVICPANFITCNNIDSLELTVGSPLGGTYSGIGVHNGYFYPAQLMSDYYNITYTYQDTNGCVNNCIFTITVEDYPYLICPADFDICLHIDSIELTSALPMGGVYSGIGVSNGYFYPSQLLPGNYDITYTFTDVYCSNTCTFTITVNPLPIVTCPSNFHVCNDVDSLLLSGVNPMGGIFSGIGVSNGYFYPSQLLPNNYDISYTVQDTNNCENTCLFTITVIPPPTVTCPADFSLCIDADSVLLTGSLPTSGTYSGLGVSNNYFNPAVALPGIHTISYTYSDTNTCSNTCTFNITVHDMPLVSTSGHLILCEGSDSILLTVGTPLGGTYSGNGVNNGYFYPNTGVGLYDITYTVTDTNACTAFTVFNIEVVPLPSINITSNSPICLTDNIYISVTGGSSYIWTGPSNYTNNTSIVNIPNAPTFFAGDYHLNVSDTNNCSIDTVVNVVINPLPDVYITANTHSICSGDTVFMEAVADTNVTTYLWSTGATQAQISVIPTNLLTNIYEVTVTDVHNCSQDFQTHIYVSQTPSMSIVGVQESCIDKGDGKLLVTVTTETIDPYVYICYYNDKIFDSGSVMLSSFMIQNVASGNFLVTLEDALGCSTQGIYYLDPSLTYCEQKVLVPDIFSPNGDNINDILYVYGKNIKDIVFNIYSRWGQKIFESTDINFGWDGRFNGKEMPSGVYVYELIVSFNDGSAEILQGDVTLVR